MRRRTLLATAGVLLSTGCSEVLPEPRQPETDDTTPGQSTTDDDAPADGTPESTATATTGDPGETTDETTTDRPTDTPDARTARRLDTARTHLGDALDAYLVAAPAEDPTLLDVPADRDVVPSDVINPVDAARARLADLPTDATESQRTTADRLREVGDFLVAAARCQSALADAHGRFDYIADRLYAGNTGGIRGDVGNLRQFARNASQHLETLEAATDPESTAAFDRIDGDTYTAKVEQFRAAVAVYGDLGDPLLDLRAGFEAVQRAADAYGGDSYTLARRAFATTTERLDAAASTLRSIETTPTVADTVESLAADATRLADAAEDFDAAAADRERGRPASQEALESGKAHLRETDERIQNWDASATLLRQ